MTTPNEPGYPSGGPPWSGQPPGYGPPQNPPGPPPLGYPAQPSYQQPVPYPGNPPYPYSGYGVDPQAPYGRDHLTGRPLSDKSAVAAGVLQLFFGFFGIGRFYIGSNTIGALQLGLGLFGFFFSWALVGLPFLFGVGVWALIDAIMIFTGSVPDNYGRKLR